MDWIDEFLALTSVVPSPRIFRLWAGICAISGAAERRIWVNSSYGQTFPSLYVLLVATPGVGKSQAIIQTERLWYRVRSDHASLKVAPNDLSKASLLDALKASGQVRNFQNAPLVEYHSLQAAAREFGVLVPSHDTAFLSVLNDIYDCPDALRELKRVKGKELSITFPQLTIFGGTQPAFLANLLPEEAWGMGSMSRIIMVYSAQRINTKLFGTKPGAAVETLLPYLKKLLDSYGPMLIEEPAMGLLETLQAEGIAPEPEHSKLQHYNNRRMQHLLKLSMISSLSRDLNLRLRLEDVERARDWLLEAEETMPDIFKEMAFKSDLQVIQDMHFFVWKLWSQEKKPIHGVRIRHFLLAKVPTFRVEQLIDMALATNILEIAGQDIYIPKAKHEHGLE